MKCTLHCRHHTQEDRSQSSGDPQRPFDTEAFCSLQDKPPITLTSKTKSCKCSQNVAISKSQTSFCRPIEMPFFSLPQEVFSVYKILPRSSGFQNNRQQIRIPQISIFHKRKKHLTFDTSSSSLESRFSRHTNLDSSSFQA